MIDEKAYQEEMAIVERHWPTVVRRLRDADAEIQRLKKRLEKCEAGIRELLCWFGPGSAASLGAKCETLQEALDAARAAVEGK